MPFQSLLNMLRKSTIHFVCYKNPPQRCRHTKAQVRQKFPLSAIKDEFRQYKGGRVTLMKDESNGIAFIILNHIIKKNALSGKMMVELNDAIIELEKWKTGKGVILYGAGDTFCSGGYLDTIKHIAYPVGGYKMSKLIHNSVIRLRNLPMVSVALVSGHAVGGGAELMLSTDFRLVTPSVSIRFVEAQMGIGTAFGGGTMLRQLVGNRTALELLLTCKKISANEAVTLGLAEGIIEVPTIEHNNAILQKATEWLKQRVGDYHCSVVRTIKKIVISKGFKEEQKLLSFVWGGDIHKDALEKNIKHNKPYE